MNQKAENNVHSTQKKLFNEIKSKIKLDDTSLKFKDKKSVLEAFKKILNRVKHRPIIVCSDLGSEFLANIFQNYLKKEKNHFVALQGTFHNAVVERQIKSIKMLLGKLWTNIGEPNWVDHVQNIITTFNNTKHSKLKIPP